MSTIKLKEHQKIYTRRMGKAFTTTAITTTDAEANEYCKKHPDEGVIAVYGNLVFIANMYDPGIKILKS
jgi:hypothetical protein